MFPHSPVPFIEGNVGTCFSSVPGKRNPAEQLMVMEKEEDEQAMPASGAVFTFGRTRFAENAPSRFWIRNDPISQVACGDGHTLLLTKLGRIFSFGANDWGQLGHGNFKVYTKPTFIKALKGRPACLMACGRSHSIAVLEEKRVVSFGQNSDGELGVGDTGQHSLPVEIQDLAEMEIQQAAAGAHHSAVLNKEGHIFLWGSNAEGQLGLPDANEEILKPTHLAFPQKISRISCGYYHTAIVTGSGDLYSFGEGEGGKLGYYVANHGAIKAPVLVDGIQGEVLDVACGGKHTIAVTQSGHVYAFGNGTDGQLGLGEETTTVIEPRLIHQLSNVKITRIICGENHSAAITDAHQLYTWGSDQYGKLGHSGNAADGISSRPQLARTFVNFDVTQVSCGGCHTIVMANPRPGLAHGEFDVMTFPRNQNDGAHNSSSGRDSNEEDAATSSTQPTGEGPSLTVLNAGDVQGSLNARARRRQCSLSTVAASRHLAPLTERAISITAEIDRRLSRVAQTKSNLIGGYERRGSTDNSENDSSFTVQESYDPAKRKTSDTELLHKEMNRSLSVFRSGLQDQIEQTHRISNASEIATTNVSNRDVAGQSHSSALIPSAPPTKITHVEQKYIRDGKDQLGTDHNNLQNINKEDVISNGHSDSQGEFDEFEDVLTELQNRSADKPSSWGEESAEEITAQDQFVAASTSLAREGQSGFTAQDAPSGKNKGPLRRLSKLFGQVKDARAKKTGQRKSGSTNGNGLAHEGQKKGGQNKSRTCTIL